jgi:hypothetical protein
VRTYFVSVTFPFVRIGRKTSMSFGLVVPKNVLDDIVSECSAIVREGGRALGIVGQDVGSNVAATRFACSGV